MPAENLHHGRDGWLFLSGGSNRAFGLLDGTQPLPEADLARWQNLIETRRAALSGPGAPQTAFLICPEKAAVYPEYTRGLQPAPDRAACRLAREQGVIYPAQALAGLPETYVPTGSHFNDRGTLVTVQEVLAHWQIAHDFAPEWEQRPYVSNLAKATLPAPPPDRYWHLRNRPALTRLDNGVTNRGRITIWAPHEPSAHGRRLVIFGDSFGLHLGQLLAATFDEVIMVHSLDFDVELTRRLAPTHVLFEWAERFLRELPRERSLTNLLIDKMQDGDPKTHVFLSTWLKGHDPRLPDPDLFVDRAQLLAWVNARL